MIEYKIYYVSRLCLSVRSIAHNSMEPLIDFIHISPARYDMLLKVQWLIIGGESGNETGPYRYRPCELEWIRHIIWNVPCKLAVFVKQLGTHLAKQLKLKDRHGGDMNEWLDAWLRLREFPNVQQHQ